jgi:alpha-L-fucosidase
MNTTRRSFFRNSAAVALAAAAGPFKSLAENSKATNATKTKNSDAADSQGAQRLSLQQLKSWESLGYGMFIHFGMSTYTKIEMPLGLDSATLYAPDRLDVDQWVSVARDAGMKYAVLTAKHEAGHCLWPSKYTDYTVVSSSNKTDVVEKFVTACRNKGIKPGLYYCSRDGHHRFGVGNKDAEKYDQLTTPESRMPKPKYTTSFYQSFQTDQITELLNTYGPLMEIWIDLPVVLGRGYRTFLYNFIAQKQPDIVIMMNMGVQDGTKFFVDKAWPSDLMAIERRMPPAAYAKWFDIEGKKCYIPGEICDPIGKNWFFIPDDPPHADAVLLEQFQTARARGVNLLLNVPPDTHGIITDEYVQALNRLRKNAKL